MSNIQEITKELFTKSIDPNKILRDNTFTSNGYLFQVKNHMGGWFCITVYKDTKEVTTLFNLKDVRDAIKRLETRLKISIFTE